MRCIHPSQRCITARQMTDNIFEIETTALARVACTPQESGILLTDFPAAYPTVNNSWIFSVLENTGLPEFLHRFLRSIYRDSITHNHSWILSVLEKTELPEFICRFLRTIYNDSTTHVEFEAAARGEFLIARGVRRLSSEKFFVFTMAFDPIFRWLQEGVIPRNPDGLDFLQPAQCAYTDDLAVAASSFRGFMTALAPAFHSVDHTAGLNLNYRKCCWVQYGSEERESLWHWLSENCEEFREMQFVRHAKYVGTMIGPDGYLHRWTAPRMFYPARVENQCFYQSPVERLCDFKIYAIPVLRFIGSVCAPDKATLKAETHALQCTTAGLYNATPSNLLGVGSVCGLGLDLVGIHSLSLACSSLSSCCMFDHA